jgi:hypothetical protein
MMAGSIIGNIYKSSYLPENIQIDKLRGKIDGNWPNKEQKEN